MLKLFYAILVLIFGIDICQAQDIAYCDQSMPFSLGPQPMTELIPAGEKRVGFCGITIVTTNNPGSFQLFHGSGTNCGTNTTPMTENVTLPSNQIYVNHLSMIFLWTGEGEAICIATTGNGVIGGSVYYSYR